MDSAIQDIPDNHGLIRTGSECYQFNFSQFPAALHYAKLENMLSVKKFQARKSRHY